MWYTLNGHVFLMFCHDSRKSSLRYDINFVTIQLLIAHLNAFTKPGRNNCVLALLSFVALYSQITVLYEALHKHIKIKTNLQHNSAWQSLKIA